MIRKVGAGVAALVVLIAIWAVFIRDDSNDKADTAKQRPRVQLSSKYKIVDLMKLDPQFETFRKYVTDSKTDELLATGGPYTVFAPSSTAFAAMDAAALAGLTADLNDLVKRHIVKGKLTAADLSELEGKTVTTLSGAKLPVGIADGFVTVGGIKLAKSNIEASDGVVHVLDAVIPATG